MLRYLVLLASMALILAVGFGCDDRGTNITVVDLGELDGYSGIDPAANHAYTPELAIQLRNPQELLLGSAFWPPAAKNIPPTDPMPLLVLLAPEGGDRFYYFKAGLSQLARELIASGEIQPMVIYCMSNDMTFGGYFYANSDPAGRYDSIFHYVKGDGHDDLLEHLHRSYPSTIEQPSKRGIGGVGMGAYGAFRAAIKNPGVYTSISVTDGPLDFDGASGNGGLLTLFDDALAEQHARYALNPVTDSSGNPLPFQFRRDFDSSLTMPISQMFIGGAFAFSPNDTLIDFDVIHTWSINPNTGEIQNNIRLENVTQYKIADSLLPGGGDSTTFINELIKVSATQTRGLDLDFHLPFDGSGAVYAPIWDNYWMPNNLEDMHQAAGSPLEGVNMWFGTNPDAKWNYYAMTQSWISYLRGQYETVEVYPYNSFGDEPVTCDEYMFDILKEMLIFHSNSFGE